MEETIGFVIKLYDLASGPAKAIANALGGINTSLGRLARSALTAKRDVGKFLGSIAEKSRRSAAALSTVSIALGETSRALSAMTAATAGNMVSLVTKGISSAAEVEVSNARLGFALTKIGKSAEETAKKIDKVSLATALTRDEVSGMVTSLAMNRIDAFDQGVESMFVTMQDGSQATVTAMEVMSDAVQFSGKSMNHILQGVRDAVGKGKLNSRWLTADLDLGVKDLEHWNKELGKANGNQDTFNVLMKLMADRVGGATKATEGTLSHILGQAGDWGQKFADELFGKSLPIMAKFLGEVGSEFLAIVGTDYFSSIRDEIADLVGSVVGFAKVLFGIAKAILGFVRVNPWIIQFVVAATAALTVVTGLALAFAAALAPMLAFGALAAVIPTIIAGLGAIIPMLPMIALLFVAIAGPITVVTAALGYLAAKFVGAKGVFDMFTKWKVLTLAVMEGIQNLEGTVTRLSINATAELEKHGMIDQFMDIMNIVLKVKTSFSAFRDELAKGIPTLVRYIRPLLNDIMGLGDSFDRTFGDSAKDDLHSFDGMARGLANVVLKITGGVMLLTGAILQMFSSAALQMVKFGAMSNEEYGRFIGAPEAFFRLKEDQQDALIEGRFSNWSEDDTPRWFGGAIETYHLDDLKRSGRDANTNDVYEAYNGPGGFKARGNNNDKIDNMVREGQRLLRGGGPTSVSVGESSTGKLGPAQMAKIEGLLSDAKVSKEEYAEIAAMAGERVATELMRNPGSWAQIRLELDGREIATSAAKGADSEKADSD